MASPSIRRTESDLVVSGGRALFRRSWVPAEPQRLILLVHGYAEHSGRYEELSTWLAERGSAVHAYDQFGHGRSDGPRGHIDRFSTFLDDLEAVLDAARHEHEGLPVTVVGHSMGGLITATWLVERAPEGLCAALSGPALALGQTPSRASLLSLRLLSRVAPRRRIPQPIAPEALSRDPEVGRRYAEDPLVFQHMTLSLAAELYRAASRTPHRGGEVRVPVLLLHGEDDPLCRAEGSRQFHAQLRDPGSEVRVFPELRHEIFNEPEREQVFGELLDWVRKREADR